MIPLTQEQQALFYAQATWPGTSWCQCAEQIIIPQAEVPLLQECIVEVLGTIPLLCCDITADGATPRPEAEHDLLRQAWVRIDREAQLPSREALERASNVPAMEDGTTITAEELTSHRLVVTPQGEVCWHFRIHHIVADGYAVNAIIAAVAKRYTAKAFGQALPTIPLSHPSVNASSSQSPTTRATQQPPAQSSSAQSSSAQLVLPQSQRQPGDTSATSDTGPSSTTGTTRPVLLFHGDPAAATIGTAATLPAATRRAMLSAWQSKDINELVIVAAAIAHYTAALQEDADSVILGLPLMHRAFGSSTTCVAPQVQLAPMVLDTSAPAASLADTLSAVAAQVQHARTLPSAAPQEMRRRLGLTDPRQPLTGADINFRPFAPTFRFGEATATLTTLAVGPIADVEFIFESQPDGSLNVQALARAASHRREELRDHCLRIVGILEQVAAGATSFGQCSLLSEAETQRTLQMSAGLTRELPHGTLQEALLHAPTAPTLFFGESTLAPEQVRQQWHAIAALLQRHGVGVGDVVGLALRRGPALSLAIAATNLLGAAWTPLDPDLPEARRQHMYAVARPKVLVCDVNDAPDATDPATTAATDATDAADFAGPVIRLASTELLPLGSDALASDHPTLNVSAIERAGASDPAYVLFTSGSTGTPKGVEVSHGAIANRLEWMVQWCELAAGTSVLVQKTPATFDVSVWEFLLPFTHGIDELIATPGIHRDPEALAKEINAAGATCCHFVPSALAAALTAGVELPTLEHIITSGEALPAALAHKAARTFGVAVHNLYGPTEAAVDVTAYTVRGDESEIPIGAPVWNTQLYITDQLGRLLPAGSVGRLWIAGCQVANGYVGQPELTGQRFIPDPWAQDAEGARMYDSGDLATYNAKGQLLYRGRADRQIKLHGQRLEPGEVENVLLNTPSVAEAAVGLSQQGQLTAWVVRSGEVTAAALLRHARSHLPAYMVPTHLVFVDALPTTVNGKLDAARLPQPAVLQATGRADEPREPVDPSVQAVIDVMAQVVGLANETSGHIGADANFFEIGGDSLSAVELAARLREHVAPGITVADVFAKPTARQLACAETTNAEQLGFAPLITLREHDPSCTTPPIVCLHPAGGVGWVYARLIALLEPGRGVYAVQAPGLADASTMVPSIAEAARRAAKDLAHAGIAQCDLLGWSVGGVIAQELGCLLRASTPAGEPEDAHVPGQVGSSADAPVVRKVLLLDAYPAELWRDRPEPSDEDVLGGIMAMAGKENEGVHTLAQAAEALHTAGGVFSALSIGQVQRIAELIMHNAAIMRAHETRRYPGRLLHVRATENPEAMDATTWEPHAKEIEYHSLPTTHPGCVAPTSLALVARLLASDFEAQR